MKKPEKIKHIDVVDWDWKSQPDWEEINLAVSTVYGSFSTKTILPAIYPIENTGGDSFAVLIGPPNLEKKKLKNTLNYLTIGCMMI